MLEIVKDLGVLLEDTLTKSGLTNSWEIVMSIVAQFTMARE
jgi:hypothetical protein